MIQGRGESGPAISRITLVPAAGNRREPVCLQIEAANAMVVDFAKVQRAVRPDSEAVGIIDLPGGARSVIARKTCGARARNGRDMFRRGGEDEGNEQRGDQSHCPVSLTQHSSQNFLHRDVGERRLRDHANLRAARRPDPGIGRPE